jgi:hypothetical protein
VSTSAERVPRLNGIPPYLYRPETIARFQERLRTAFLSGDTGVARVYLRELVERIMVEAEAITIDARADAAVDMMAARAGEADSDRTVPETVLTDVVSWRPRQESNLRPWL